MIPFEEALQRVLDHSLPPRGETVDLENALGRVLLETVTSDLPMPPFHRSAVDGFALPGPGRRFLPVEEITARPGTPPPLEPGRAAPIMTGAPIPQGADRVVMVEHTRMEGDALVLEREPRIRENICFQGEDLPAGAVLLCPGAVLTPAALGVLAMAGACRLTVARKPGAVLMTTGDEVVDPRRVPGPGEVRNANATLGRAVLEAAGFGGVGAVHVPDSPEALRAAASEALFGAEVLLAAGGVSMGTRDHVPGVMESLGFRFLFREVSQKPGKPLCFAVAPGKAFFGLPGNPVSVLVALEEVVIPFLRKSCGCPGHRKIRLTGMLEHPVQKKPGRTQFYRAVARYREGKYRLEVPSSRGSGDLMSAVPANCLMVLPRESTGAPRGGEVPFSFLVSSRVETVGC